MEEGAGGVGLGGVCGGWGGAVWRVAGSAWGCGALALFTGHTYTRTCLCASFSSRHQPPCLPCARSPTPPCAPRLPIPSTPAHRPQADKFHKTGRQLRSRMWWQNMKMKLIIVAILLLIAVIIFCAVCFSGGNCLK